MKHPKTLVMPPEIDFLSRGRAGANGWARIMTIVHYLQEVYTNKCADMIADRLLGCCDGSKSN